MTGAIPLNCPWSGLTLSPTAFCEQSLCAWIRQPANTLSNLGFILAGVLILRQARSGPGVYFSGLGWVAIMTAIGSAFYHASESRYGAIMDYFGMYLGSAYMFTTNLYRFTAWKTIARTVVFWSLLFLTLGTMIINENLARTVYGSVSIVCCLGLETAIYFKNRRAGFRINYKWFWVVWFFFSLSYLTWKLDEARWICDPQNHWFNGHALWHLLNAASLYFLFLYYRQFSSSHKP